MGYVAGNQKPGDFLSFVDPAFGDKAVLEVEAGPEQIAPLDPDVVILRSFMADKLGKPLGELDIPVVYVDLETPEQYFRDVAPLGELFGNEARAAISRDTRTSPAGRGLRALGDGPAPDRQKTEGVP